MSAVAIHPSPRTRAAQARRARSAACPQARPGGPAVRHLRVVADPAPRAGEWAEPAQLRPAEMAPAVPQGVVEPTAAAAASTVAGPAPAMALAPPRLRLTVRGRRVMVALGFALSVAVGGGLGSLLSADEALPTEVTSVVVQPGESLWAIASESAAPGQDVRDVVDQIRALNGLEHSTVHAGQELSIPLR